MFVPICMPQEKTQPPMTRSFIITNPVQPSRMFIIPTLSNRKNTLRLAHFFFLM